MQAEKSRPEELSIQESKDKIHINVVGLRLLYWIAAIAFVACLMALVLNLWINDGVGNGGAVAGIFLSGVIFTCLRIGKVKAALVMILWGFATIPLVFGLRTFGFSAPGIVLVPISIMAASWALSMRHAIIMTTTACIVCVVFFFLIRRHIVMPVDPELEVRLVILVGINMVAFLLGLIGARALRFEFQQVRELATSLEEKVSELGMSEASFSRLFLSNPLPSLSGDFDGNVKDVNAAFLSTFGFQKEWLLNRTIRELGIFEDEEDRKAIARLTMDQDVIGRPVTLRLSSGETRNFLISTSAFEMHAGWRFVASLLDQTDRLAAERAQQNLNIELEQRVEARTIELSEALNKLQRTQHELVQAEKLASLGAMVAGIAHELNTPVGNALMVSTTLTEQRQQFEQSLIKGLSRSALNQFLLNVRECSEILERSLHRTTDLIHSFKQIAVDQTREHRGTFDLQEVVHEVYVALTPNLLQDKHQFFNENTENIELDSFPDALSQVLMILMSNSLKHGFGNGRAGIIRLRAQLLGNDWLQIHFIDDGVGISQQNIQRIFDPFFTTKMGQGGSGLGLSIAYNLVTAVLGGRLEVKSEQGKGTEFIVEIPRVAPSDAPSSMTSDR